jgi:NADH-quinone oxidoreductase subunit A
MASQFIPVLITFAVALVVAAAMLGLAVLVGQRQHDSAAKKGEAYESGVPLLDRAQKRISVKFYLVALIFVVLDVEVAFLYPWAVTYREQLAGNAWVLLLDMLAFILLLALVYIWLWKKGVFDWARRAAAPILGRDGGA